MNRFDVSVYAIRRRAGRRRPFEVRWQAAGRSRSKSFITRRLADSYRAELVRAARMGLEFDPLIGEPAAWSLPEPATVTWYQEAAAYAVMKWPSLAAHSRASLADALATVTPVLTRPDARYRPDLRTVLYQHAFNPARPAGPGSAAAQILGWARQASLPISCLSEPTVLRTALEALTFRLDGSRAAGQPPTPSSVNAPSCTARSTTRPRPGCYRTTRWTPSPGRYHGRQQPSTPRSWPAPPRSARSWTRSPRPGRR